MLSSVLGENTAHSTSWGSYLRLSDVGLSWLRQSFDAPFITADVAFWSLVLGSVCAFFVAWGWWLSKTRAKA